MGFGGIKFWEKTVVFCDGVGEHIQRAVHLHPGKYQEKGENDGKYSKNGDGTDEDKFFAQISNHGLTSNT